MPIDLPRSHHLRPMTPDDLGDAHRLSKAVGWPHRLEDLRFVLGIGHGLVAAIDDRVVGTAMWWIFSDRVARLGMVIVDPALQKAGIGKSLMNAVLDRVSTPAVMLMATEAGEPLYRRLGFEAVATIMQYQGVAPAMPQADVPTDSTIEPASQDDLDLLIDLDAQSYGVARPNLLCPLMQFGEVAMMKTGGKVVGFAACRMFGRGRVIGPVIAHDEATARVLIAHWIGRHPASFLRFDVPDGNGLGAWLQAAGYAPIAPGITMVRGEALAICGPMRSFAYVNQALG